MNMPAALWILILGFAGGNVLSWSPGAGARVTVLDAAVVVTLLFCAMRERGVSRHIPKLWLPVLAFAAVAFVSLGAVAFGLPFYVAGGGLLYVLRWITYAALYWAASGVAIPPQGWYRALLVGGTVTAILGLLQLVLYPDLRNLMYLGWDPHYRRLFGALLDPNFTGIILAATVLLAVGADWGRKYVLWQGAVVAVSLIGLMLTYSRSSILALGAGLVVWGIVTGRKKTVAALIGAAAILLIVLPKTGEGRDLMRTASAYARLGSMERAVNLIAERPVLGFGFNTLRFVARERSWIDEQVIPSRAGAGLDTSLLFVGATTGFLGMAAYLWLMVRLVVGGLALKPRDPMRGVYLATLAAFLVHSLFINSLFYPWVMAWLWILTGAVEQGARKT